MINNAYNHYIVKLDIAELQAELNRQKDIKKIARHPYVKLKTLDKIHLCRNRLLYMIDGGNIKG